MHKGMKLTSGIAVAVVTGAALVGCGADTDGSSETVTLRLADILPETHFISENHTQHFIEAAESLAEERGHELSIDFYPDGQLGAAPDQIDNLRNGLFDIALLAPSYTPDQLPASDVFNLPYIAGDSETLANAYYEELLDESSEIHSRDFVQNEMVPLSGFALPQYQIATTFELQDLSDVRGKLIRSGGGVQNQIISTLGASPVTLTTSEQYEGLQRGTIDGGLFSTQAMIDNRTAEVLTHFTSNANTGGFVGSFAISDAAWNGLPEWGKEVLRDAGESSTYHFSGMIDELGADAASKLVSDFGLIQVDLSAADVQTLEADLTALQEVWAETATRPDMDAASVLQQARDAVESVQ